MNYAARKTLWILLAWQRTRKNLVRPERFELPTYSSGGCRSIQLSYGRTPCSVYMRELRPINRSGFRNGARLGAEQQSYRAV